MILTLDTNILISALGWKGPEYTLMKLIFDGEIQFAISPQILEEFIGVAKSEKFNFTDDEIDDYLDALLITGKIVFPDVNISIIKTDPADNRILECAVTINSEYIITGNKHLLKLKRYKEIEIVNASKFLKEYFAK